MKELTEQAQRRLDQYLDQVRASLAGCESVNPADVEADVRDHIERELQSAGEPVTPAALEAVLEKLGSPRQWVPEEDMTPWRRMVLRLRTGPDDWRLAYVSFGVLVVACLAVCFPPAAVLLLLCSFLAARAAISTVADRRELGVQRWLVYPALALVYVPFTVLLLFWPAMAAGANHPHGGSYCPGLAGTTPPHSPGTTNAEYEQARRQAEREEAQERAAAGRAYQRDRTICVFAMVVGTAVWIAILGLVLRSWPRLAMGIYRPFADGFTRRHANVVLIAGLVLTGLLGGVVLLVMA